MQTVIKLLVVFILGSTFGYGLEVAYRSYKLKRLINPGFLVGCCLPIYGIGWVVLYLLCSLELPFIHHEAWRVVFLTVIATILMTLIEYIVGLTSIKVFKNRLWDYSDRKGNIQGIICPTFSLVWGVCCLLFYFLVFPWISIVARAVAGNFVGVFFIGIYLGVLAVDLGYSMHIMTAIRKYAIELKNLVDYEKFKHSIAQNYRRKNGKFSSTFSPKIYTRISHFFEERRAKNEQNNAEKLSNENSHPDAK